MEAKRTVTIVRKYTFAELFDKLEIFNDGKAFDEVHITVNAHDNNRGQVTIVTKKTAGPDD